MNYRKSYIIYRKHPCPKELNRFNVHANIPVENTRQETSILQNLTVVSSLLRIPKHTRQVYIAYSKNLKPFSYNILNIQSTVYTTYLKLQMSHVFYQLDLRRAASILGKARNTIPRTRNQNDVYVPGILIRT